MPRRRHLQLVLPEGQEHPRSPGTPASLDDHAEMTLGDAGQRYTVRARELEVVAQGLLGRGAYGVVETMRHPPSGAVMAVKRIQDSQDQRKNLTNEILASMRSVDCPFMVRCFGAMFCEGDVWICMEIMDLSLNKLIKVCFDRDRTHIPEPILGKIAHSVISGLHFMKDELRLMHCDVKPSNILMDKGGRVKICDYGISGQLVDSMVKTIRGCCKPYMPPEKVKPELLENGQKGYDIRSDVWSVGITLLELAMLEHPFAAFDTPFKQLAQVVEKDPPRLPLDAPYSQILRQFIDYCLTYKYTERPRYPALLVDPFIIANADLPLATVSQFVTPIIESYESSRFNIQDFSDDLDLKNAVEEEVDPVTP